MYKMFTTSLALAAFASLALAQDTVVTVTEVLTISNAPVTSLASYTSMLDIFFFDGYDFLIFDIIHSCACIHR